MRIPDGHPRTELGAVQGPTRAQAVRPAGSDDARKTGEDGGVHVRVSAQGRELSLQTGGPIDAAKVARLKSSIESGTFKVDAHAIADRMVRGG